MIRVTGDPVHDSNFVAIYNVGWCAGTIIHGYIYVYVRARGPVLCTYPCTTATSLPNALSTSAAVHFAYI